MAAKKVEASPLLEIESATLHQPVSVAGALSMEKSLNPTKTPGVKLSWSPMGLIVERKGKKAIVPSANVAVAVIKE